MEYSSSSAPITNLDERLSERELTSSTSVRSSTPKPGPTIPTTGVDTLILAAMMEESAQALAAANHQHPHNHQPHQQHYSQPQQRFQAHQHHPLPLPTGRGLGYLAPYEPSTSLSHYHTYHHHAEPQFIPTPSNKSELELYTLLDRANLLNYFGTFINFGGDDVRQLVEADEEEFLEIMTLIGMTRKPLHVRRFQKALHEWKVKNRLAHDSRSED